MEEAEIVAKHRIYLAAPFPTRLFCVDLKFRLAQAFGPRLEVHAPWLHDHDGQTTAQVLRDDPAMVDMARGMAERDLRGVHFAHGLVLYNPPEFATSGTGGRHCETGAALLLGRRVFVLGVASNIFHRHRMVTVHEDEARLRDAMRAWIEAREAPPNEGQGTE